MLRIKFSIQRNVTSRAAENKKGKTNNENLYEKLKYCADIFVYDTAVVTADICYDDKNASCDSIIRGMHFETMQNAYPE